MLDETHDPKASSWVPGADAHADFPAQNLPLGRFSVNGSAPRTGIAIGEFVLDLKAVAPLLGDDVNVVAALAAASTGLRELFLLPSRCRRALRRAIFALLTVGDKRQLVEKCLIPAEQCVMHMPMAVRDYTDFYAGIHHARKVGSLLRPDNPLLPNYKYVPVGYHGRASSVRISPDVVVRPNGQLRPAGTEAPVLGPTRRLDYELELGFWIGGEYTPGQPIPIGNAQERLAGVCLLNDWSARDVQAWEYVPLGPFLAKNFATTITPWIITAEALAPFRTAQPARPEGDPAPLPYLLDERDQASGALGIALEVTLRTRRMREVGQPGQTLCRTTATNLYWTPAQLVTHHTVNGCDLGAGDLIGTGTISGPDKTSCGSLMELTSAGANPVKMSSGETRAFLEDGDELAITGRAEREGYRTIGFGRCVSLVRNSA